MGGEREPLERIAIGNVVPLAAAPTEPGVEAAVRERPRARPQLRSGSVELLEAAVRIAVGLVSLALSAVSATLARSLPEGEPTPEEELEDAEPLLPPPRDPVAFAVGATLGLALEAGRVATQAAAELTRRAERLLSWVPVPGAARVPMQVASDELTMLNERWRDEQPLVEELATAFARALLPGVVDATLDQLDLTDLVVRRVDLDRVVGEVDVARIIERVDLNAVIAQLDLERIVERIDVQAIVDRIPLDEIVGRLDLDAIVHRLDLAAIAQEVIDEIDLPAIIRESSGAMAGDTVQGLRLQTMDADRVVARVVDRVLRRRERDAQPPVEEEEP